MKMKAAYVFVHVVVLERLAELGEGGQQVGDQPGGSHAGEVLAPGQTHVVVEEVEYHFQVAKLHVLAIVVLKVFFLFQHSGVRVSLVDRFPPQT